MCDDEIIEAWKISLFVVRGFFWRGLHVLGIAAIITTRAGSWIKPGFSVNESIFHK